uniref:membrane cofactor protein-like isoform X2 n=1 Tax=Myxine glutinosa TaxID=7769 RepID=UPI00358EAE0D
MPQRASRMLTLMIVCTSILQLSPVQAVSCGEPLRVANAVHTDLGKADFNPGDKVVYQCSPGYKLVDSSDTSITCKEDGSTATWTPVQFTCTIKMCKSPPSIDDGYHEAKDTFPFGSTVTYSCHKGYVLVQSNVKAKLTCMADARWDRKAPECEAVQCAEPPQIPNGSFRRHDKYEYGMSIRYTCNGDFTLLGRVNLVCTSEGVWDVDPPECKVVWCPYTDIENGELDSGYKPQFGYQEKVKYKCNENYVFEKMPSFAKCQANGTWSTMPVCIAVQCAEPPQIPNGSFERHDKYEYGVSIRYTCDGDFTLLGRENRICTTEGEWDVNPPECKELLETTTTVHSTLHSSTTGVPSPTEKGKFGEKECNHPPAIANGVYHHPNNNFAFGVTINFSCLSGYTVSPGVSTNLTCVNGQWEWHKTTPFCKKSDKHISRLVKILLPSLSIVLVGAFGVLYYYYRRKQAKNKPAVCVPTNEPAVCVPLHPQKVTVPVNA